MKMMKKTLILSLILILSLGLFACGEKNEPTPQAPKEKAEVVKEEAKEETKPEEKETAPKEETKSLFPLTVTDDKGREITLEKMPKKVAALSGTTLYIYGLTGGTPIAGPSLSKNAPKPEGLGEIVELGHMANMDVEKLISLNPDFVLLQSMQAKLIPVLEENNIPYYYFNAKSLEEIKEKIMVFSKFSDHEEKAKEIIQKMDANIEATLAKISGKEMPQIAIMHVTGRGLSLKLSNSIAGDCAKMLGLKNITEGLTPEKMGMDSVTFDLEMLVAKNPERIFITSMVSQDENVEEVLKKHLQDSTAWSSLDAVKNGKVHYLPQSHFLFNPVDHYDEAIEMMAKDLWPEAFE